MRRHLTSWAALMLLAVLPACAPPDETSEAPAAPTVEELPITTESEEARASFVAGLAANDVGRFVDAHNHMLAAIAADPESAMAHWGAAITSASLESFAGHLKTAGEKAAGASDAEQALIEALERNFARDFEGQLAAAQRAASLIPNSPRALLGVASAHASLGDVESERATAAKAAEMDPASIAAYTVLGNSYLFSEPRDFAKAEETMNKIAELAPDEPNSHDLLGDVHRAQGNLEAAHAAYTKAAELDVTEGSALQQRGHVNSFLGNYDEARADYQAAMDLSDPDTAAGFAVWKALVSVHAGDPAGAIAELNQVVTDVDGMEVEGASGLKVNALFNAWMIAMHEGMADEGATALAACRELLMAQADEVGTDEFRRGQEAQAVYMEGMLAAAAGDSEGASAAAEAFMALVAADADPHRDEPAHEILGRASLAQGNFAEAVAHYEQADPNDVYAQYHLGLAHEGAGNAEAAQAIFDSVAKNNFNFVGYALIRADAMAKASP